MISLIDCEEIYENLFVRHGQGSPMVKSLNILASTRVKFVNKTVDINKKNMDVNP